MWRELLAAALLAAGTGMAAAPARACDPQRRLVKIVDYRAEVRPYTRWVTIVDEYGCEHRARKTFHRSVAVPVVRWEKVCD